MKVLFLKNLAKNVDAQYTQQNIVNYNIYRKISVTLRDRKSCKDTAHTWEQPYLKIGLSQRSRNADAPARPLHSQQAARISVLVKMQKLFLKLLP